MHSFINTKKYLILFFSSLGISFLFSSPLLMAALRGYHPELRFFGDLQILAYPALIQTSKYLHSWIFRGIDFFTANGSSSIFLRPNISSYFLPQLLLEFLSKPNSDSSIVVLLAVQIWVDLFLAMLFTSLWLKNIIKVNLSYSIVGGTLFAGFIGYVYFQLEFLQVVSIFPMLLYCLSSSLTKKTNLLTKLLFSLPFIMILTAGYIPIALMAICVAIITSLIISKFVNYEKSNYKDFFIVLSLSVLISSGYIIAIFNAVSIITAIPKLPLMESVFFSDLSLTLKGIITIFLASASPIPNDIGEAPHFRLGLPITILVGIVCQQVLSNKDIKRRNILCSCVFLFLLSLLLAMGKTSGLADIFFYNVPILGGMHIYARYMLISVFFVGLGIVVGLPTIYESYQSLNLRLPFVLVFLIIMVMVLFPSHLTTLGISLPILSTEVICTLLILFSLCINNKIKYSLLLIMPILFFQGALIFMQNNWISIFNQIETSTNIVNDEIRKNNLINYFSINSNKQLIKYIDITPEIEKPGGLPQNFPWFIRYDSENSKRISSYMGYESHLSQQKEYCQKIGFFGHYDKKYLLDTGVDYIIYNRDSQAKDNLWLSEITDKSVPEFDMGNGYFVIKVLQNNNSTNKFNNGIFTLTSEENAAIKINKFETNWSTKSEINFESSKKGTLFFNLFPHKNLKFYINGNLINPLYTESGVAYFSFPSGKNIFTVSYSNPPLAFFLYCYFLYILLVIIILVKNLIIFLRNRLAIYLS